MASLDSGLYVLLLELERPLALKEGALGRVAFPAGWYLYTGSARRGLSKRVARHLARKKAVRWHIDRLTTEPAVRPLGALLFPPDGLGECALHQAVGRLIGGTAPVPGFGSSDCRARCPAHLWHSARPVSLDFTAGVLPEATSLPA